MNMDLAGHGYGSFKSEETSEDMALENLNTLRNPNATKDQLYIADMQVKRFIDHLKEKHLFDTARIIVTSDHGMSTMKNMFSTEARKKMLQWICEKIPFLTDVESQHQFIPPSFEGQLDIDIRQILSQKGIHMRASPDTFLRRYNPDGDYDWCISEGPNGYIYHASPQVQHQIKHILMNYTIEEDGVTIHPIWKVLIREEQTDAINEYTGRAFNLGKDDFLDVIWPSVMVFCRPHYMIPMYHDQLMSALMPLMIKLKLPGFIDIKTAMGAHGTYLEQDVPLLFVSKNEGGVPAGEIVEEPVSVLDIIPTINDLNGWGDCPSFEGTPLF